MRRAIAAVFALLAPAAVFAQSAAQRALDNEPEARQIQGISQSMQQPAVDPLDPSRRQGPVAAAVDQTADIRRMTALLDQLERRLSNEARACGFCDDKQAELSELIRQRMDLISTSRDAIGHDRAGFAMKVMGLTPNEATRWSDIQIAFHESAEMVRAHCAKSGAAAAQDKYCSDNNGGLHMAADHERAWSQCFNKNQWVEDASRRRAYEACMSAADPLTQMCVKDNPGKPLACTYSDVSYMDVNELHFWNDRWNVDPTKLTADATLVTGQAAHVTLLQPLVAPPGTAPGAAFTVTVRGRLGNALAGDADPIRSNNPTLQNALRLDQQLTVGVKGRFEAIPAGTEVPVEATVAPRAGQPSAATLTLTIGGGANEGRRPTNAARGRPAEAAPAAPAPAPGAVVSLTAIRMQPVERQVSWPQAGAVILPANTELAFVTACGCALPLTLAELKQQLAAHPVSAAAPAAERAAFNTLVIPAGSRILPALTEPVTVSGIQAGKRFHAALDSDVALSQETRNRSDVLDLKKGTDVFYKVTDQSGANPSAPGRHNVELRVDYVVLNGAQVPVKVDTGLAFTYDVAAAGARQTQPNEIIPIGMRRAWTIVEDVSVTAGGLTKTEAKMRVAPPAPGAHDDALRRDVADYNDTWIGHAITLRGVVSKVVAVRQYDIAVHFKESPDDAVVVCFKLGGQINQTTFNAL
ncbi:MAG TPA: hypothetical protein VFX89_14405, partial [Gammaproteobacteria bacterium]|nr:hypothetical protein [Gammaproteobacteria bacterium]